MTYIFNKNLWFLETSWKKKQQDEQRTTFDRTYFQSRPQ